MSGDADGGFGDRGDIGPVAEYRDPELVARFEADTVPGHRAGFWDELEAALAGEADPAGPLDDPGPVDGVRPPVELRPSSVTERGWGPARLVTVAAAVAAVIGFGGLAVVLQNRATSPIESAAPTSRPDPGTTASDDQTSTTVAVPTRSTATASTTATGAVSPPPTAGEVVDYFGDGATVARLGAGRVVGFSPDDSAVLVLDDAQAAELGCEAAPRLALYAQDLATGERRPALGADATVESGGLDLLISPFGATPAEVGTRPVYWTDWCDGERDSTKRGVLAPDGTISMVEDVEPGGDDDPFAVTVQRAGIPSPDGAHLLRIGSDGAVVTPADGSGPPGADAPRYPPPDEEAEGGTLDVGVWSPSGEAVALATSDTVVLWNPWTSEQQRFDASGVARLVFDNAGRRLAVVSWSEGRYATTVLTFGGLPAPTPAPAGCSGRVDPEVLTADALQADGVPVSVATTAALIDRAASSCDWEELEGLISRDFVASFGGSDPATLWRDQEAAGQAPMSQLRVLLRQPWAVADETEPATVVWPSLHLRDDCAYDEDDRRALRALGRDPTSAQRECETVGGYIGHRAGIDLDGRWRFFVAGD